MRGDKAQFLSMPGAGAGRRFGGKLLMILAVIALIAGLDAADRYWRTRTKAPQSTKADRWPPMAGNDTGPDNQAQLDETAPHQ